MIKKLCTLALLVSVLNTLVAQETTKAKKGISVHEIGVGVQGMYSFLDTKIYPVLSLQYIRLVNPIKELSVGANMNSYIGMLHKAPFWYR